MQNSSLAPLLSAAANVDCIWIIVLSPQPSTLLRSARQHFDDAPILGLRQWARLGDAHHVTFLALALLVVRVHLGRTAHDLAVQRMLHLALEQHGDRLLHLVADHATFDRALGLGRLVCLFAHVRAHLLGLHFAAGLSPSRVLTWAISRRTRLK